jgi:DNA polymerase-3 subunit chi
MTRVDFYLLEDGGDRRRAVCRLAHKAHALGHRIYILTESEDEAVELDQLLWTFTDLSFVPHALHSAGADPEVPVLIGANEPPGFHDDVLITLTPEAPAFFTRFRRVAEVVGPGEEEKVRARSRYRFYRERGCTPNTHTLGGRLAG